MSFDQGTLARYAELACSKVLEAASKEQVFEVPFRHVVVDDFLPRNLAELCLSMFPKVSEPGWEFANDADIEVKYRSTWRSEFDIPDGIIDAVRILNSAIFLRAMSDAMRIEKIVPDPYFTGGGLNVTTRGGLLDVHVDGNYHDATGLNRRLNAILYLNPEWQSDWGGELGLYDAAGANCVKKIAPTFNRLVLFDSHDHSFHGLPEPVNFPASEPRRSIILYYYTMAERPREQVVVAEPHSALWKKRGVRDKKGGRARKVS